MMSKADKVRIVLECHHAFRVNLGQREQILQDIWDSITQSCVEIIEDQVWEGLAHWIYFIFEVMSQHDIGETEISCRSERQMADNHTVWLSSGFVKNDHICEVVGLANLDQVFQDEASSINPNGIRYNKFQFFLKLGKSLTGISTCSDKNFWITIFSFFIFIIDMWTGCDSFVVC